MDASDLGMRTAAIWVRCEMSRTAGFTWKKQRWGEEASENGNLALPTASCKGPSRKLHLGHDEWVKSTPGAAPLAWANGARACCSYRAS